MVHLRNPEVDRYARISFELEVGSEKDKDVVAATMPLLRDSFIAYLSDRTMEELRGSQALERTKAELFKRAELTAQGAHLRGLYITDFVVQ